MKRQQRPPRHLQQTGGAALILAFALTGCSKFSVSTGDIPASGPDPGYDTTVANRIKSTFKDYGSYDAFEISTYRWVHSIMGWSWLTCVRFQDHGHRRTYAVFLKGNDIIESRYAIQADGCDTISYVPFDLMGDAARPPTPGALAPLY